MNAESSPVCDHPKKAGRCRLAAGAVTFVRGSSEPADVTVSGAPEAVFRWLWGRADDDAVQVSGDPGTVRELKARLVEAAQ